MSEFQDAGVESRTIAEVQASTRFLLESFKAKMADLKQCGPDIRGLLRFGVNLPEALVTAREFFGSEEVSYMAIDGTDSVEQQLDLIIFYVGAFAYGGKVKFARDGVEVGDPKAERENLSVSAAIPLSEEDAAQVFGQKRESGVEVESERLPFALMHLAEYYLAYKGVDRPDGPKLLLLDRTLAGDVAHLVWSTRDLVRSKLCVLEGMETLAGKVTAFDLELARMLLPNRELHSPAPRSQLLKFAAITQLFNGDALTSEELISRTGADPGWRVRLEDDLRKLDEQFKAFETVTPSFKLVEGVAHYWDRVLAAAMSVCHHIFNPGGGHPLRVAKDRGEVWVTADDLDFLVLVFIRALTRKAWSERILPVGFIKDTNAFEFVKAAVPLLVSSRLMKAPRVFPNFNSDKMLLQTNSVANSDETPTPWHTAEIDAAFRTMAPVTDSALGKGEARVNGAFENVIYPERVYLKTYIQLWSSATNPSVRSHVFTFDRPVYPGFDHWDEILLFNEDGPVDGKISPVLHYERGSPLTNMCMAVLT